MRERVAKAGLNGACTGQTQTMRTLGMAAIAGMSAVSGAVFGAGVAAETKSIPAGPAWMLEVCARYLETGARAGFGESAAGGRAAEMPAGPCGSELECAPGRGIFRAPEAAGPGAVEVRVPTGPVGDAPEAAICGPAQGLAAGPRTGATMPAGDFGAVSAWAEAQVAAGRMVRLGAHRYAGCAWNDRIYQFAPQGGPMAAFRFTLSADAPACDGAAS